MDHGDEIHKPEFRGHSVDFWKKIQLIHDSKHFWIGNKLNVIGEDFVKNLKKAYSKIK